MILEISDEGSNNPIINTKENVNLFCRDFEENYSLSLKQRIICHIAESNVILKSQQKYEPDLTLRERKELTAQLIDKSPSQFLYRFGKNLRREHLHYFAELPKDPEIDFYLLETQKILNEATSRTRVRNRRYGALCKLQTGSSYFSEEEMQKRNPLLYDELVGNNLTDEDKAEKNKLECNRVNSFSELLLECMDRKITNSRKNYQQEVENDAVEEFDEDEEGDEEDDDDMEAEIVASDEDTKELLKNEFKTSSYAHFLMGKDDAFDYSLIDGSDEYDMLDYQERDEEERYFDED